jgi:hypothetical protein
MVAVLALANGTSSAATPSASVINLKWASLDFIFAPPTPDQRRNAPRR